MKPLYICNEANNPRCPRNCREKHYLPHVRTKCNTSTCDWKGYGFVKVKCIKVKEESQEQTQSKIFKYWSLKESTRK